MAVEPKEPFPFSVEQLLESYPKGRLPNMFPDGTYHLYGPEKRAILEKPEMHVSKTLHQFLRQNRYSIEFDKRFETVMQACIRPEYRWITDEVIRIYNELHRLGYAHSSEALQGQELVGGLYGIAIGRVFFIESMFTRQNNASKVALYYLLAELRTQNFEFVDLQFLTPHLASLGAIEIPDELFVRKLSVATKLPSKWGSP